MLMMRRMKAVVQSGRVVVEDQVDYPDGTKLELDMHEPTDELDEQEQAKLDAFLDAGQRAYEATGKAYTVDEARAWMRARR